MQSSFHTLFTYAGCIPSRLLSRPSVLHRLLCGRPAPTCCRSARPVTSLSPTSPRAAINRAAYEYERPSPQMNSSEVRHICCSHFNYSPAIAISQCLRDACGVAVKLRAVLSIVSEVEAKFIHIHPSYCSPCPPQ